VINKADKGSTIVIQDVENYISDGLAHLTNTAVYRHLQKDSTPKIKKDICLMLEHLHRSGMLSRDMLEFCMPPKNHRTSQLYFLKKSTKILWESDL
jgi:2-hydroxy-3-keto-5-methylthiopentenyl-1-phosphate phosphatase